MNPNVDMTISDIKNHLIHNKFIIPSCQLYKTTEISGKGFQTYGHIGLIIKNKIINQWRKYFVTGISTNSTKSYKS